jgi:3',5'-cyclic-AMP phosphodiesterase
MRILFASDFHIMENPEGKLKGVNVRRNAERVFSYIADLNQKYSIDLLVLGGDLSHDGSEASYRYINDSLETVDLLTRMVPGNHDRSDGIFKTSFSGLPSTERLGLVWRAHFIDSRVPCEEFGQIPVSTFDYLRSAVLAEKLRHLLVLHHDIFQLNPPHRPGITSGIHDLLKVFQSPSVEYAIILSGHRHRFAAVTIQNITLVNSGAVSCQFNFNSSGSPVLDSVYPELLEIELPDEKPPMVHRHIVPE